jgi:cell wall-associated NlpC family hydrolase
MKRIFLILMLAASAFASGPGADSQTDSSGISTAWPRLQATIGNHLGRPYVWGAVGLKSFDCSGFVWRVMAENGVMIKRTTARKLYMSLPVVPASRRYDSGNIVFFDNLTHCGIIANEKAFYHAESSTGTNLSKFDPFWRPKMSGVRAMPGLAEPPAEP